MNSTQFEISAKAEYRYLSFAAILGITNDGFTGIDGLTLPRNGSSTFTWILMMRE